MTLDATSAYLGVDAGNSKTVAIVATGDGHILGRGRGGTGDIYGAGGADGAVEEVCGAVRRAMAAAGVDERGIRRAAFRLAGVDWSEDATFWEHAIAERFPSLAAFSVHNDGFSLLRLGSEAGTGVSVIAGTGGAIAARGADGRRFSMSFWIQDWLGAVGLGSAALRAVVRADLGIGAPTDLSDALLRNYGEPDVAGLLRSFTRREGARSSWEKATASRLVLELAARGDAVALAIVRDQARHFAENIAAAARRVGFAASGPFPVLLGGALVTAGNPLYREELASATKVELPHAAIRVVSDAPVIGAVLDAIAEDGGVAAPLVRDRLTSEEHPSDFLVT